MAVVSFGTYELVRAVITRTQDMMDNQRMMTELDQGCCKLNKIGTRLVPVVPLEE